MLYLVSIVQRPRTPGFQPGNRGSIPLGDELAKNISHSVSKTFTTKKPRH